MARHPLWFSHVEKKSWFHGRGGFGSGDWHLSDNDGIQRREWSVAFITETFELGRELAAVLNPEWHQHTLANHCVWF